MNKLTDPQISIWKKFALFEPHTFSSVPLTPEDREYNVAEHKSVEEFKEVSK